MKNLIKTMTVAAMLISTSTMTAATLEKDAGFGLTVGSKVSSGGEANILAIQNIQELIGDGGTEVFIEPFYKNGFAQVGARYSKNSSASENKIEMTWKLNLSEKENSRLKYFINGGFGFGQQGSKTATISTNITKAEYITQSDLSQFKVSTEANIEDSTFISFSIGAGAEFAVTDNLRIAAGYEFERKSWDLEYSLPSKSNTTVEMSGIGQNFHGVRINMEYKF